MAGRCQLRTAKNRTRDGGSHQCPSGLCCMTMQLHIADKKVQTYKNRRADFIIEKVQKM